MTILTGAARVAGIIGWPVAHSRSPRLHGYWLDRYRLNGAYVPLPTAPAHLTTVIRGLAHAGLAGANVTIPHKVAAFAVCDTITEAAKRAGAVNTLVFEGQQIRGDNTDGWGFLANLRAHGVPQEPAPALILGAGGAARAIAAALQLEGRPVTITNRTAERAERLAVDLPGLKVIPWAARAAALRDHAIVVNATALGMDGHPPLDLDLGHAAPNLVVCDVVYVPLETSLLASARGRGLKAIDGLGMLLYQAVPGFHAWFGVLPDVDDPLRTFVAADLLVA